MALTPDQVKQLVELLKQQAAQQQEINSGIDGYLQGLKKAKAINETIVENRKIQAKLQKEVNDAAARGNIRDYQDAKAKLDLLRDQTIELVKQGKVLKQQLKDADKLKMTFAAMSASLLKGFNKLPGLISGSFGKLKSFGLFEMDKAIRTSATEMGKMGGNAKALRVTLESSATKTLEWGMGIQELAKMQSAFSDELGRTVMMGKQGLESVSAMAAATGLGVEGAAKLTAEMDNQGLSAKRTADFVEQTMNDSSKMGLNTGKVIKNIQNNMKMLNKYNFKGGVKGLAKMAQTTAKLGVDMNFVSGMADKLFDIEGAVDMSAQLQVMGGEWAELADPFKLMYMARNDMEGLTEAMGHAAASSAHFNKENGEFEISSLEMHKLRKIAEQTGVSYEELAQAGKNAAKFSRVKSQISFSTSGDKKMEEFLTNSAQLDESGRAFIMDMKGDKKFLDALGAGGKDLIKAEMANEATLKDRAKAAQSFDEKITNLINLVKTYMMPIIEGIDSVLRPVVDELFKEGGEFKEDLQQLGKDLGGFVKGGLELMKPIGQMVLALGPRGVLYTFLAGKALAWIADKMTWLTNGLILAQGFNAGASGKGGFLTGLKGVMGSGMGKAAGAIGGAAAGFGGGTAIGGGGKGAMIGSGIGTALGALGYLIPGVGLIAGPALMALGGMAGGAIGGTFDEPAQDAIFNPPVHDGEFNPIKSDKGKGKDKNDYSKNRGIIQGGKITRIDNKDKLLAMKPGGGIMDGLLEGAKDMLGIGPKKVHITFGEIHFKFDDLVLKTTDGITKIIGNDLLKTPTFTRDITRMIHVETEKAINGGVLKG